MAKMLVKRWSSNTSFGKQLQVPTSVFSTKHESFWDTPPTLNGFNKYQNLISIQARDPYEIHPDHIDFQRNLTWTMSQWHAFMQAVLLDKVLKSSVFSACEKCQRSRRMVGGKRRKQHFLRFLELSSCFLFAWGTVFFARKLRNDASFTNHMCIFIRFIYIIYI